MSSFRTSEAKPVWIALGIAMARHEASELTDGSRRRRSVANTLSDFTRFADELGAFAAKCEIALCDLVLGSSAVFPLHQPINCERSHSGNSPHHSCTAFLIP